MKHVFRLVLIIHVLLFLLQEIFIDIFSPFSGFLLPFIAKFLSFFSIICYTVFYKKQRKSLCKQEIGYSGDIRHAWIDVYIRSKGWVNQAVSFKGDTWTLMDPTFDSNSDDKEAIQDYIGDESNYTVQFTR